MGPEEKKYKEWEKDQRENHGLTSIRVSLPIRNIECKNGGKLNIEYENDFTTEEFYKAINDINEAYENGNYKEYIEL